MITYPSTHGIFEETVREVCAITHAHGGQVYLDGANLNALVGLVKPGEIGADVSHLNLHKTFCIPHGGGGPGMGPIGVKAHLAPYLPGHPETGGGIGPVSAAPYGSPGILPIPWAYILMMGGEGLTQATKVAILNANYIAKRLEGAYPILFLAQHGRCAHECIVDIRPFAETAGVTVDDVAKRLIDNGFHAPTMSWPVAGTLMIEPTESRRRPNSTASATPCWPSARRSARSRRGGSTATTTRSSTRPTRSRISWATGTGPTPARQGCFPKGAFRVDKYWPPVNRVDNVFGDRNLVCTCPPMEAYQEAAE
jgi:glycine dehydrogenase